MSAMIMKAARVTRPAARVSGFSLVELMIALVLGTVIVLGAVGLFITNQRTFQLQQSLTDVQQQGSFTQGFMMTDLRKVGYQENASTPIGAPVGIDFSASTDGGAAGASDKLTFSFEGRQDCGGQTSAATARIVESYFVKDGNLVCNGSLTGADTTLLAGVASFQVLYGMDLIEDNQAIATRYATATVAPTLTNDKGATAQVVALRIAYIVEQASGNPQNVSTDRDYMLLEQKLTDGSDVLSATNQVRREFVVTIPVRNFDWRAI